MMTLIKMLLSIIPGVPRKHRYRKAGPAEFLRFLTSNRPATIDVDRYREPDGSFRWRLSFALSPSIDGVVDHFAISFSAGFVPATFRAFIDRASAEMDRTGAKDAGPFDRRSVTLSAAYDGQDISLRGGGNGR